MDDIERLVDGLRGGEVLDVATGQGHFALWMAENLKGVRSVVGIDESEKGFEKARQSFPNGNATFLRMDAAGMNFDADRFDTVGISNSVHHFADRHRALSEVHRVLKPGGVLLLSEMYRDGLAETQMTHALLHHWWAEIDRSLGVSHFTTLLRSELFDLLAFAGFALEGSFDYKNLDGDPKAPETIGQFEEIIEQYLERAAGTANGPAFRRRGAELRRRLHAVGFHPATSLIVRARKPLAVSSTAGLRPAPACG